MTEKTFGQYLKSVRCEKNICLEKISQETCIRSEILYLIENEEHDKLPEQTFVKGFLRAYAKAVGADGDKAVRLYLSDFSHKRNIFDFKRHFYTFFKSVTKKDNILKKNHKNEEKKNLVPRPLLLILIVLGIVDFFVFVAPLIREQHVPVQSVADYGIASNTTPHSSDVSPQKPSQVSDPDEESNENYPDIKSEAEILQAAANLYQNMEKKDAGSSATAVNPHLNADTEKKDSEKLLLKIDTIEETWMRVFTDGHKKDYNLKPGDNLELETLSDFYLVLGNAGGVKLSLNNVSLPEPGRRGEVVKVRIPSAKN